MTNVRFKIAALFLLAFAGGFAAAQNPSLFLSLDGFHERAAIAQREPWAKADLQALIKEADEFPQSYEKRYGLTSVELPPEGGQWLHWYVCPDTGTPLTFRPPNHHVCPDTGKEYPSHLFDQVVYQLRNDALRRGMLASALAYRFTGDQRYARKATDLLTAYADRYQSWPLHDNHGKPTANGGKAYSQTLDESIWLIDLAWSYDLVRGSGLLDAEAKKHIEVDLLRASYATVSKAHKEPTFNIQSWINAAIAAVGYTLHDDSLIHEALDGPIGFRYQMKQFVHEGFWIEGTFGYHFYALRALVDTAQMAKSAGTDLWKQEPALLSLFTGPLGIVLPDGELPAFNDSNRVDLFAQDYLYEEAYASSKNAELVPVVAHDGRTSRESLLFGVERIPPAQPLQLKSQVFPVAGYAALRNSRNDLTVIAKFGEHGGAHGHYDKLNFILYSQGRVMGLDPGTQLYGLPLHAQWDSKTIAHNTLSVDESRQAAATGKLIDWQTGPDWVSVTMDAGPAYADVRLERTIVLTSAYCLLQDRAISSTSHTIDWIYHNRGVLTVEQPGMSAAPETAVSQQNGYEFLKDLHTSTAQEELRASFVDTGTQEISDDANPNSPAATVRSADDATVAASAAARGRATIEVVMPVDSPTEFLSGVAPGHDLKVPIPFIMARRKGADVTFTSVLSPTVGLKVRYDDGTKSEVEIVGPGFADEIDLKDRTAVHHNQPASGH